jgi:hypothetical protein
MVGIMTPPVEAPSGTPFLSLAEAAKASGVSVSTIRRKRPELKELGAAETAKGWQIPVTALITLGLMDRVTAPLHEAPSPAQVKSIMTPPPDAPSDSPLQELEALRKGQADLLAKLADAERRAAVAEAVATERERIIQTQATALRMLEAAPQARQRVEETVDHTGDVLENVKGMDTRAETSPATAKTGPDRPTSRWSPLRRLLNR